MKFCLFLKIHKIRILKLCLYLSNIIYLMLTVPACNLIMLSDNVILIF